MGRHGLDSSRGHAAVAVLPVLVIGVDHEQMKGSTACMPSTTPPRRCCRRRRRPRRLAVPGDAAHEALTMVAAVRHDPALRLHLTSSFYDDQPHRVSIRPYRRAELAFMRWQVRRGVLASPQSSRPGSQWWRSVNESLLRDAWEAHRLAAGRPGPASKPAVLRRVDFLGNPCARTAPVVPRLGPASLDRSRSTARSWPG